MYWDLNLFLRLEKNTGQKMSLQFPSWMAYRSTGWLLMTVSDS